MSEEHTLTVRIDKERHNYKWIVRIENVPDCRIISNGDGFTIEYELPSSRLEPRVVVEDYRPPLGVSR